MVASTTWVILEKWFLIWQAVPGAERGIWGWACGGWAVLAGCLHGHHLPATQESDGVGRHRGTRCQKHFISPLKKNKSDAPSCSWWRALPQPLPGRARPRGVAMCQPQAPCLVCTGGRRSLFQEVFGRACQRERRRVWGRCGGGSQSKPREKVLFMLECTCLVTDTCRGMGGMQQGTPRHGEQPHASMGTAPRGPAGPFGEVDMGSLLM